MQDRVYEEKYLCNMNIFDRQTFYKQNSNQLSHNGKVATVNFLINIVCLNLRARQYIIAIN